MNAVAAAILRGQRRVVAPLESRDAPPRHQVGATRSASCARCRRSRPTTRPARPACINIHRGADLLNNTVVEPGKVFSLNQTVGPRTAARGFVTAPVFAQGEFFDDYGGGVSQLATTTYNAAFFGGYADVTHQPHTIYISRYPPGREATVNYGVIDLQFRDDTRHGILIRAYYSATSVTVDALRRQRRPNRARREPHDVEPGAGHRPADPVPGVEARRSERRVRDPRRRRDRTGVDRRPRLRRRVRPRDRQRRAGRHAASTTRGTTRCSPIRSSSARAPHRPQAASDQGKRLIIYGISSERTARTGDNVSP